MAAVVVKRFDEAAVLVSNVCDKAVVGYLCGDCAFPTEHSCVGLVDCLPAWLCWFVVVCGAAWGELESLAQPGTAVGHAGPRRTVGRVWGSAHALRPTWHFAR